MAEPPERPSSSAGSREPWKPGSRVARLRASHTYAFVLVLIAVTFVFVLAVPDERWSVGVLVLIESVMLAVAVWASGMGRVRPAIALVLFGAAVAVVELATGGSTVTGLVEVLDVVLVAASIVVIGLGIFDQGEVNRQSVSGAICVYLLLGILFTFVFGAVAVFGSGDFFAQGTDGTPAIRIYFSYVTLATLGYGDYTAASSLGRGLAIGEALLGQLYLVTVVALLVGHFGMTRRSDQPAEADVLEPGQ
jgi:hypothetical protein